MFRHVPDTNCKFLMCHTCCQTESSAIVASFYWKRAFRIHTFPCNLFLKTAYNIMSFPPPSAPPQIRLQHIFNALQPQFTTQGGQTFADLLVIENEFLCGEVPSNLGNKQSCAPQHSELTPPTSLLCLFLLLYLAQGFL